MDLQLKDKVVLITGGAKGIGEAISRGCVREELFLFSWTTTRKRARDCRVSCRMQRETVALFMRTFCRRKIAARRWSRRLASLGGWMCWSTTWARTITWGLRMEARRN